MGFGVYHTTSGSTIQNVPEGVANTITLINITMKMDNTNYRGVQALLDQPNNHIYTRSLSSSWSPWKTLI